MTSWYERNREKAINDAKQWRLNNLERFRATQSAWKRRKTAQKRSNKRNILTSGVVAFIYAPGFDPGCGIPYPDWCARYKIDPKKSWNEPTDEYFE